MDQGPQEDPGAALPSRRLAFLRDHHPRPRPLPAVARPQIALLLSNGLRAVRQTDPPALSTAVLVSAILVILGPVDNTLSQPG